MVLLQHGYPFNAAVFGRFIGELNNYLLYKFLQSGLFEAGPKIVVIGEPRDNYSSKKGSLKNMITKFLIFFYHYNFALYVEIQLKGVLVDRSRFMKENADFQEGISKP